MVLLKEDSACPRTQIAGRSRQRSEDGGHHPGKETGLLLLASAQTQKHAAIGKVLLTPLGNNYDSKSWYAGSAEQGRKKLFITSYVS